MLTLNATRQFPAYDDESRGIAGLYRRPEGNAFRAILDTDPSRAIVLGGYFGFDHDTRAMRRWIASFRFTVRVTSWMEYVPMVTLARTRHEESWAIPYFTAAGRNLFGDRDVDQADFSLRGTVAFSRSVTAQFFTQVFLAKGTYRTTANSPALDVHDARLSSDVDRSI